MTTDVTTEECEPRADGGRRERRRQAIIDAARALFVERGYDAVSLSEIVKKSGGSLATLYALFDGKSGILGAIVASQRFDTRDRIDSAFAAGGAPATILRAIADLLLDGMTDPEITGLMRIVMGETLRDPAFAQSVYKNGHIPSVERVAGLLADWHAAGRAVIPDPMLAAHLFFGLVIHGAQTRALFGAPGDLALPPRDTLVSEAMALFTTYYHIDGDEPA